MTMIDGCANENEAQEREHLAHVVGKIASELAAYSMKIDARLGEARTLVTELEDSRAEMDHIEKADMRQTVNLMTRIGEHGLAQQQRLSRLVESPYFGRIDINFV